MSPRTQGRGSPMSPLAQQPRGGGWRPALRMARRTVLRSRGRSLLIAILIGLPVAGATFADVIARTFSSPERTAQRVVGSADGAITVTSASRLTYDPRWLLDGERAGPKTRDPATVDAARLMPAGTRLVAMPVYGEIALRMGARVLPEQLDVGDVREPLHQYAVQLAAGHAPGAGEALLTHSLAGQLGLLAGGDRLRPGAAITLDGGPTVPISGLARDPDCLSCPQVVASSGSVIARTRQGPSDERYPRYGGNLPTYLVDLPRGTDVNALGRALAARGVALTTRDALAHPERFPGHASHLLTASELRTAALVALIVALGLLEIVLLAGTAFAVGARRQVRELGLVAASGGSGRDVRRIVLAQGLVLGAIGAGLGVVAGSAVAVAGRSLWEHLADSQITSWSFGPWEIAGAALVGLASGLAAALLPAIGAGRMAPVNALAGRFRTAARGRRRGALAGVGLLIVGVVCGVLGERLMAGDFSAYERALAIAKVTGGFAVTPRPAGPVSLVIAGAAFGVVGLVLIAPALIGQIARAGGQLPLSARLAVRDAERHRHRTGPATGAIVIAVTGSVVLAFLLAGVIRAEQLRNAPSFPARTFAVARGDGSVATMAHAAELAAAQLPGARRYTLAAAHGPVPKDQRQAVQGGTSPDAQALFVQQYGGTCPPTVRAQDCGPYIEIGRDGKLAIGGDDAVTRLVAGPGFDAPARRALADGKVLVFAARTLDPAGDVHITDFDGGPSVRLPGYVVASDRAYEQLPAALVSARTARAHGWSVSADSVLVTYGVHASREQRDAAISAARRDGALVLADSEPSHAESLALSLITAAAAFVTLVGVAISIALSAAEGRADLATLAAVGAPPRRRRALMASQALLVGGLGCLLGVGLGSFVAFTARATTGSPEFVVPWANLAATAIGIPLLAALVAALCTRSRLPMVRRAE